MFRWALGFGSSMFPVMTPSQLDRPAFLMNVPFSFATDVPNNKWMEDMPVADRTVDRSKAIAQFFDLYHFLSARALVAILPTPRDCLLQDLVFTANLGFVPEHLAAERVVVLSQFSSPPRRGEEAVGARFFGDMGYEVHPCPHPFEGEAELRYLYDNVYVGGYGQRSSREAYDWMEEEFDLKVIKVEERDPYCYHLDCSVFPVTGEQTLVATHLFSPAELRELEAFTEIIPVDEDVAMMGGCNSVMLGEVWLNGTIIEDLSRDHPHYAPEKRKNELLESIASQLGKEVRFFDLGEFQKGGASLSCLVMHLNRQGYVRRSFT